MSELTEEQRRIRERYEADRGYWIPLFDDLLRLDPGFLDRYRALSAHPTKEGFLDPKLRELLFVALDASATHLYEAGVRGHIHGAFDAGATVKEILEVLELTTALGFHALSVGVPALERATRGADVTVDDDRRQALRDEFESALGYWDDSLTALLDMDPDYFEKYLAFVAHPWREGGLDPVDRELVSLAVAVAPTHLYEPAVELHVGNALERGASPEAVLEVFQVASNIGVHAVTDGVPVLVDVARDRGRLPEEW